MLSFRLNYQDVLLLEDVLTDTIELTGDSLKNLEDDEREEQEQFISRLEHTKEVLSDKRMLGYTELAEKAMGFFWERFKNEGVANPDVEYLLDTLGTDEEDLRWLFNQWGFTEEEDEEE